MGLIYLFIFECSRNISTLNGTGWPEDDRNWFNYVALLPRLINISINKVVLIVKVCVFEDFCIFAR